MNSKHSSRAFLGFSNLAVVSDPHVAFKAPNGEKMSGALVEFMCNTLSSNLVPEPVKQRRIEICREAVEVASLSINRRIFDRVMYKDWGGLLNSVDFGLFPRRFTHLLRRIQCILFAMRNLRNCHNGSRT